MVVRLPCSLGIPLPSILSHPLLARRGGEAPAEADTQYPHRSMQSRLTREKNQAPRSLDQQEIPALHLHHIPPGNVRRLRAARSRLSIHVAPHLLEEADHSPKAPHVG